MRFEVFRSSWVSRETTQHADSTVSPKQVASTVGEIPDARGTCSCKTPAGNRNLGNKETRQRFGRTERFLVGRETRPHCTCGELGGLGGQGPGLWLTFAHQMGLSAFALQ